MCEPRCARTERGYHVGRPRRWRRWSLSGDDVRSVAGERPREGLIHTASGAACIAALTVACAGCGLLLDIGGGDEPARGSDGGTDAGAGDAGVDTSIVVEDATWVDAGGAVLDDTACDDVHERAILCEGFEAPIADPPWRYAYGDVTIVSEPAHRGIGAMRAEITSDLRNAYLQSVELPYITEGEVFARAYFFLPSSSPAEWLTLLHVEDGGEPWRFGQVKLIDGVLSIREGAAPELTTAPTQVAEPMPRDRWVCIELRIAVAEAGAVELFLEGRSIASFDGVDMRPMWGYRTLYAALYEEEVRPTGTPSVIYMDEVVVDTTRIGCDPSP